MNERIEEKIKLFDIQAIQSRSRYDEANAPHVRFAAPQGLSREVVLEISRQKQEPAWMLEKRLAAYEFFIKTPMPSWGPDLSGLNLDTIVYFVRPDAAESRSWDDVPSEIRNTFEKLGIPQAEREALAGVGAQYDSDIVYHNLKKEWEDVGVIFENMDVAVKNYPELVKEYFMTSCIPIHDHKFVMLHAAVWSGGTFIYVPPGVTVTLPMQAYFRMNAEQGGQFEHTLIIADKGSDVEYIEGCSSPRYNEAAIHAGCVELYVKEGARLKYSSIENWSKNTYNLNTKRALVDAGGTIEWLNGNMGSCRTMLYPASILRGKGSRSKSLGIAVAGPGQVQDTGSKVIHVAPNTSSTIRAKSLSIGGGVATYRGMVRATAAAKNTTSEVTCDALILDEDSAANTYPTMRLDTNAVTVAHEATVGKIGDEEIFYLMSRGISEEHARQMIVAGFFAPIVEALPLEYALELNRLIEIEMEGAVG